VLYRLAEAQTSEYNDAYENDYKSRSDSNHSHPSIQTAREIPCRAKRMIMAIRITQLASLPSVAFIAPVAAKVTTATVSFPLYSEGSDFWGTPPKLNPRALKRFSLIARFL
jgi:hypothetical protein